MIKIEKLEEGFRTYSDEDYMIRPILDRLGNEINPNAIYDEAEDIEVNGQPRFDYEETEIKREKEEENNGEN
jgi:hypothetical protein